MLTCAIPRPPHSQGLCMQVVPRVLVKKSEWVQGAQSRLTLYDPMSYPVHGILQARTLEWVALPFSRASLSRKPTTKLTATTMQGDRAAGLTLSTALTEEMLSDLQAFAPSVRETTSFSRSQFSIPHLWRIGTREGMGRAILRETTWGGWSPASWHPPPLGGDGRFKQGPWAMGGGCPEQRRPGGRQQREGGWWAISPARGTSWIKPGAEKGKTDLGEASGNDGDRSGKRPRPFSTRLYQQPRWKGVWGRQGHLWGTDLGSSDAGCWFQEMPVLARVLRRGLWMHLGESSTRCPAPGGLHGPDPRGPAV